MGNIFFDPRCNVLSFQQTDPLVVGMCGKKTGYIICIILTTLIMIYLIGSLY